MVAIIKCLACRAGDCEHCSGGSPAPEGMMGGTMCPCEGQCEREPDTDADRLVEAFASLQAQPQEDDQ